MTELLKIADTFLTSRPVFRLTKRHNGTTIDANSAHPVYRYRPVAEEGNVLSELMCQCYQEEFRGGEFTLDKHRIASEAMREIRNSMTQFLEKNLEMRSPKQSKVFRWYYRNLPSGQEFDDTLVMVYKYLRSFCDDDLKSSNLEHTKNAIALLDAIMEKYDER